MAWLYGEPINARPFRHVGGKLDLFCARCDLSSVVYVVQPDGVIFTPLELIEGTAIAMGYHGAAIRPELNGFQGYDTLSFAFISEQEADTLKAELGLT